MNNNIDRYISLIRLPKIQNYPFRTTPIQVLFRNFSIEKLRSKELLKGKLSSTHPIKCLLAQLWSWPIVILDGSASLHIRSPQDRFPNSNRGVAGRATISPLITESFLIPFPLFHFETNSVGTPSAATSHVIDSIPYIHIKGQKNTSDSLLVRRETRSTIREDARERKEGWNDVRK